jgi:hypothetical protein
MQLAIDEIIQNGQVFNLRRDTVMSNIRDTVRSLFVALQAAHIDYLLVGGVALLTYVEGRNTQDIDLVVDPKQINALDWQARIRDRDLGIAVYHGLQVDLRLTSNPLFAHVWQHERSIVTFDDLDIVCVTREGLVLLKLYALPSLYRQGNLARAAIYETDILMLLQGATVDTEALLAILTQHLALHDIDELRRILGELQARRRFS